MTNETQYEALASRELCPQTGQPCECDYGCVLIAHLAADRSLRGLPVVVPAGTESAAGTA